MSKTSTNVKNRWNAKTYKRYTIFLRYDVDGDLIKALDKAKEDPGLTEYIRQALKMFAEKG